MCPVVHLWQTQHICYGILCKIRAKYWVQWQTDMTFFSLRGWFLGRNPTLYVQKYIRDCHLNRDKVRVSKWRMVWTWHATYTGKWNVHNLLVRQYGGRVLWYRWGYNLECVGEVEYECILWISGIQDAVKWWDFVNMVINSEVLTAVLLKIEGFLVGLTCQQHVFNL